MSGLVALLIVIACMCGSFLAGTSYGKSKAYDQAFKDAVKLLNEIEEDDA